MRVEAGSEDHQYEYRMMAADGRIVWFHMVRIVKDSHNETVKLRRDGGHHRTKASEQALRESEEQFQLPESPIAMNLGSRRRFRRLENPRDVGNGRASFRQHDDPEVYPSDDQAAGLKWSNVVRRRLLGAKATSTRAEKPSVEVFGDCSAMRGEPLYGLGIAVDITEHKRAEQTLRNCPLA
jgi:PAS domain-containing protein